MTSRARERQHDREVFVSKAKLVLIIACLIAIPVTFYLNHQDTASVRNKVVESESPCVRYGPKSKQCHEAFQAAIDSITDFQLCTLLSKRPDLTGVVPADCRAIAREARRAAERALGTGDDGRTGARGSAEAEAEADVGAGGDGAPAGGRGGSTKTATGGGAEAGPRAPHQNEPEGGGGGGANNDDDDGGAGATGDNGAGEVPEGGAQQPGTGGGEAGAGDGQGGVAVDAEAPLPVEACAGVGPLKIGVNCP